MNAKQFLMIVTLFSCATNRVSATAIQTCNAEQIVNEIIDAKLTVDDTVLYDHEQNVYTVNEFEVTKMDDGYHVICILKKPINFLGTNWGDKYVKVTANKKKEPQHLTQEAENLSIQINNDIHIHNVKVNRYNIINENKAAVTGFLVICFTACTAIFINSVNASHDMAILNGFFEGMNKSMHFFYDNRKNKNT